MTRTAKLRELLTLARSSEREALCLASGSQARLDRTIAAAEYRLQLAWLAGRIDSGEYAARHAEILDARQAVIERPGEQGEPVAVVEMGGVHSEVRKMKTCKKCGEVKEIEQFAKNRPMPDGRINKCKTCIASEQRARYQANRERYATYELRRQSLPKRKADRLRYQQNRRKAHPDKARAWKMVYRAKRAGKLVPTPCLFCGDKKVQAHHEDYSKPLEVLWLCFKCHRENRHGQKTNPPQAA